MILYGWNNYLLKSVQPEELGISRSQAPDLRVEYRQKYFHLFFIPVFPLGKFWAIRKQGQMYEPSVEMKQALQAVDVKTKHWIWAWSGILLVVGGLFIFNLSERLERRDYQKRAEASASVLGAFFKDDKNTEPLAKKLRAINYITDSCVNDESYEKKKIDTGTDAILKRYFEVLETQSDSLVGYTHENTVVFSCINHKKSKSGLPDESIAKALSDGEWKGYSDTSSVFKSLNKLKNYKYLLVLKEYNRLSPVVEEEGYNSGVSLLDAYIFNVDTKAIEKKFKVLATNSEKVSQFTVGRKGSANSVSRSEWRVILENDLNSNAVKAANKYVFHEEASGHL